MLSRSGINKTNRAMNTRHIKYKENNYILPCPKCSNNTEFVVKSNQVSEDACDIWAACKCGYDPTSEETMNRIDDVWGGVDNDNCEDAINFTWNDIIKNN